MNNSKNLNDMQILFLKQIIDTLQLGVIPWVENSVSELKYNGISGKLISGIDRMLLNNGNKQANCYLSYQQVIKNRITILKGEHSLYNFSIKEPEGKYYRYTRLFNTDQLYMKQSLIKLKSPMNSIDLDSKICKFDVCNFYKLSLYDQTQIINNLTKTTTQEIGLQFRSDEQLSHTFSISNYLIDNLVGINTLFSENQNESIQRSIKFINNHPQEFMRSVYLAQRIVDKIVNQFMKFK